MDSHLCIFRCMGPVGEVVCLQHFKYDLVETVRSGFWIMGCMIKCVGIEWHGGMFGLGYPCHSASCGPGVQIRGETGSLSIVWGKIFIFRFNKGLP